MSQNGDAFGGCKDGSMKRPSERVTGLQGVQSLNPEP